MELFWHRRDLRAADNRGLATAATRETVVPVFVFDDAVLEHGSPPRVAYMLDALESLQEWYQARDSDLVIAHGDPTDELPRLAAEHSADRVVWNKDYSGIARERDAAVRRALDDADIARESHHDHLHHKPGSITTNKGEHYSVYTYFWKKWRDRPKADPFDAPAADSLAAVDGASLPSLSELGFADPEATVQSAARRAARERLAAFCDGPIYEYEQRRDYPADECTSRLSADLKWGTLGIREVYDQVDQAHADAPDETARESAEEFQSQLAWREFYYHVLAARPDVVTENYKEYEHEIEWRDDTEEFRAWKRGETGYPIVDAGMRQLQTEAYMHNRVRMIVASFLTKDLQLDWRKGYDWFRQKLVDHDTANDNGGWQWAASTGTDAQPYFRIFNPMTQGERYDPDAEYIKTYVPELRDAAPDVIHSWHECSPTQRHRSAPEYPEPIVDHSQRREAAIEMFERARGD